MSSSASCSESSSIFESHGMLATSTSYVNKSSSIPLIRLTSLLKTLNGVSQEKEGFQLERLSRFGLEVGSIRHIQGLDTAYWGFLRVRTTLDIFKNIHILYLQYDILTSSGYSVLSFIPLWSLVSADTDTPYLP
ncbi:hypothetical protein Tco_1548082 [Tanacetum coccineum]